MIWARIDNEYVGFAWKRLSSHEIDPDVSNGHEFQGVNGLSLLLGSEQRSEIPADYYLINDDDSGAPSTEKALRSTSSWYDSRKNVTGRSAEWRLYYPADAGMIQQNCNMGDLMLIGLRKNGNLSVMLIAQGSHSETAIRNSIGIGEVKPKGRGNMRMVEAITEDRGLEVAEVFEQLNFSFESLNLDSVDAPFPTNEIDLSGDPSTEGLATEMLHKWPDKLGSNSEVVALLMKYAALPLQDIQCNPDYAFQRWLEMAEAAYRTWKKQVFGEFLRPIRYNDKIQDSELGEMVSEKWMSFRQSRVSRAGKVMEHLLDEIFRVWRVAYEWEPKMSGGKRPDFIFPGKKQYEDQFYDANHLRLLGAKTSMKERWRQILAEGDRVKCKHGVTRDVAITPPTFDQMDKANFTVVMPNSVISKYEQKPHNLISLQTFLEEVSALDGGLSTSTEAV